MCFSVKTTMAASDIQEIVGRAAASLDYLKLNPEQEKAVLSFVGGADVEQYLLLLQTRVQPFLVLGLASDNRAKLLLYRALYKEKV